MGITEKRRFGLKNEVTMIFESIDMQSDLRMSSRTRIVAVAVNAISGMSNFRNLRFSVLKLSLSMDNRLKWIKMIHMRHHDFLIFTMRMTWIIN